MSNVDFPHLYDVCSSDVTWFVIIASLSVTIIADIIHMYPRAGGPVNTDECFAQ